MVALLTAVRDAVGRLQENRPGGGRTRRLLTTVLLPAAPGPESDGRAAERGM